jgi:DNA-binding transcriptional ArsR family regulator
MTVLDDAGAVAAVLPPLRRRLLAQLRREADSAAGLARKLGLPRQKVNYHLRKLEEAGVVELAATRRRRGCVERTLRPTARAFLVDPSLLEARGVDAEEYRDRFSSAYLVAAAAALVGDVSDLRRRAEAAGQPLTTFTLQTEVSFRTPAQRTAFAEELTDTVARLVARYHDDSPGSRSYRFLVGGHPAATSDDPSTETRPADSEEEPT